MLGGGFSIGSLLRERNSLAVRQLQHQTLRGTAALCASEPHSSTIRANRSSASVSEQIRQLPDAIMLGNYILVLRLTAHSYRLTHVALQRIRIASLCHVSGASGTYRNAWTNDMTDSAGIQCDNR